MRRSRSECFLTSVPAVRLHTKDAQRKVKRFTRYLLVDSPLSDDGAFLDLLAAQHVFCLPGSVVECPGHFRISLTANDEMIERALPGFTAALEEAKQ